MRCAGKLTWKIEKTFFWRELDDEYSCQGGIPMRETTEWQQRRHCAISPFCVWSQWCGGHSSTKKSSGWGSQCWPIEQIIRSDSGNEFESIFKYFSCKGESFHHIHSESHSSHSHMASMYGSIWGAMPDQLQKSIAILFCSSFTVKERAVCKVIQSNNIVSSQYYIPLSYSAQYKVNLCDSSSL